MAERPRINPGLRTRARSARTGEPLAGWELAGKPGSRVRSGRAPSEGRVREGLDRRPIPEAAAAVPLSFTAIALNGAKNPLTRTDVELAKRYKEWWQRVGERAMSPHDPVPHRSRRERQPEQPERAFPHSWVRVLRSDDELHSAVETALAFERGVVERTTARVSHYEDLNRHAVRSCRCASTNLGRDSPPTCTRRRCSNSGRTQTFLDERSSPRDIGRWSSRGG